MVPAVCAVCSAGPPKYKCPTCFAPYCSVTCCRVHKETPCQRPDSTATTSSAGGAHSETGAPFQQPAQGQGSGPAEANGQVNGQANGQANGQPRRPFEDDGNEEEARWRLSHAHFVSIAEDSALRLQLRDHNLQRLLGAIDSAQDPALALQLARGNPTFARFMEQLNKHLPAAARISAAQNPL